MRAWVAYMILQLVKIPKEFGNKVNKVLDKLRYLQAFTGFT